MDLYSQFVEKWRLHYPKEDPPLIDFHGCTSVTNEEENVNVKKLESLHVKAKQTTKTLRDEWQKADFIEKFLADLIEVYSHRNVPDSRKESQRSPIPSPRLSGKEFSMKEGLGRCINSSVEALVNLGLGRDAIDVTENHEIQINCVVGKPSVDKECVGHKPGELININTVSEECQHKQAGAVSDSFHSNQVNQDEVDARCLPGDEDKIPASQRWSLEPPKRKGVHSPHGGRKNSAPERGDTSKPQIKPRNFSRNVVRPKSRQHSLQKSSDQVADKFFSDESTYKFDGFKSHTVNTDTADQASSINTASEDSLNKDTGELKNTAHSNTGSKSEDSSATSQSAKSVDHQDGSTKSVHDETMRKLWLRSTGSESGQDPPVLTTSYRKISQDGLQNISEGPVFESKPEVQSQGIKGVHGSGFSRSFHGHFKKSSISRSRHEALVPKTSSLPTTVKRSRFSDFENVPVDYLVTCPNDSMSSEESEDDYVTLDEIKTPKPSVDSGVDSVSVESAASGDVFPSPKDKRKAVTEDIYDNVLQPPYAASQGINDGSKTVEHQMTDEPDGKGHVTPDTRSEDESPEEDEQERIRAFSVNTSQRLRQQKLHMRKILVKGILESELTYLKTLHDITELKRKLQDEVTDLRQSSKICSMEDVTNIFQHIEEIHKQHTSFVNSLQEKVNNWSDNQQIGETFKELVVYFPLYMKYVNHNHEAQERLHKCCQENEKFKEMVTKLKGPSGENTSLQEILFTPVQRLQRNTLVLHDLIKHTPDDHPDHKTLTKALDLADHNLRNFGGGSSHKSALCAAEDLAHLVKSGFVVEMEGRSRKLRFLFLFSDVLVCTKHKQTGRHKVNTFEVKWYIPVKSVEMEDKIKPHPVATIKGAENLSFRKERRKPNMEYDQPVNVKEDLDAMKKKIVSLKSELRTEVKAHTDNPREQKSWSISGKVAARNIDKLRKKIEEQEATLILASPRLPLHLKVKDDSKDHTILLSTDFEREEWRDAIQNQQTLHPGSLNRQLSGHDIQVMINDSKQLPQVNNIGTALMKKDEEVMNGALNVTIHKLNGLEEPCDTYVELHLDSYGHFFMKARTGHAYQTTDPTWDEDFELELDGSQSLRILCYKKTESGDTLIGRSALELSTQWLSGKFQEQKISMNELSLTISVRHTPATKTLKRTPSKIQGGIFGARISVVTSRERKTVPSIVTACIKEVESRGMTELGIYRVSGVTSDVQKMKKAFDKNVRAGIGMLANTDIHAVTGVLKLYFRELPEPLFTDARYKQFLDTVALHDGDAKEKVFLELLHDLPNENYYTIVSMIEHLVRISKQEAENKMSLSNLATIFGPTLLHPAVKDGPVTQAELMQGAQEAFLQAGVLQFLLTIASKGKSIRRSERTPTPNRRDVLV